MSRSFKNTFHTNSGRTAFGVFKEPKNCGDYTYNKTAKTTFCVPNVCVPSTTVNTQGNKLLLYRSNKLTYYSCSDIFNKSNLNVNLITKLDLQDIPVIQNNNSPYNCPTDISSTSTPYLDYSIDPSGILFGNNTCGINNSVNYLQSNPPPTRNLIN